MNLKEEYKTSLEKNQALCRLTFPLDLCILIDRKRDGWGSAVSLQCSV